jgi:hypothetical protein
VSSCWRNYDVDTSELKNKLSGYGTIGFYCSFLWTALAAVGLNGTTSNYSSQLHWITILFVLGYQYCTSLATVSSCWRNYDVDTSELKNKLSDTTDNFVSHVRQSCQSCQLSDTV